MFPRSYTLSVCEQHTKYVRTTYKVCANNIHSVCEQQTKLYQDSFQVYGKVSTWLTSRLSSSIPPNPRQLVGRRGRQRPQLCLRWKR